MLTQSFSIITPSFNSLSDLPRCIGSIRGQVLRNGDEASNIRVEHIVQDGGSEHWQTFVGTLRGSSRKSLGENYQFDFYSGSDHGMYDAINLGWEKSSGEILSWLNCDEQYLPGTLQTVASYFAKHPEMDAVFGDAIIVDLNGNPLAARREIPLRKLYVANGFLYALSCTLFYRRSLWEKGVLRLDSNYKFSSDADLVLRLLDTGVRFGHIPKYLSLFGVGDSNLSFQREMIEEGDQLKSKYGRFAYKPVRRLVMGGRHLERLFSGCYRTDNLCFDYCLNAIPEYRQVRVERIGHRFEYDWYRPSDEGSASHKFGNGSGAK
ncbi:MAG: glycosyltransferase [Verrucomicrobiota bacterium]